MKEKLKNFKESLEPYYVLLTMIVFFIGTFITVYKYILSPSDLKLIIADESISYPASISNSAASLYKATNKKDSLQINAGVIYSFLINTTSHKKLTLKNTSNKTIRGAKFKYLNVDHLTAWGISANYLSSAENAVLLKNLQFDDERKIALLTNSVDIPARSEVVINLWGSFKDQITNDDIIASYDDGDAYIANTYTIDGVKGYILNYYFEIMIFTLLIFSICYIVAIQQIKKRYAVQTDSGESN